MTVAALLLTLPCLTQTHSRLEANEVAFMIAQENWVIDYLTEEDNYKLNLQDMFTRRDAELVRNLSCEHYSCRRLVMDVLVQRGDDALLLIIWGTRHRDAGIANLCRILLDLFLTDVCPRDHTFIDLCGGCDNTGIIPRKLTPL